MIKKHYYLIYIQFLGFRFHGWQKQPNVKTVQGMVDKTLGFIFDNDRFKTLASGRTDSLVSAWNFPFELFTENEISEDDLLLQLNEKLPPDITANKVIEVDQNFQVMTDAKLKKYEYFFSFGEKNHPFCSPFLSNTTKDLDIELMKVGAKLFIGTHNFKNYCYRPNDNKKFNREIVVSEIIENKKITANFFPKTSYIYRVHSAGFLQYQVRMMIGALIMLGAGEISIDELKKSLTGEEVTIKNIAPSSGLFLEDTIFD